jgi:hypothetical protein
MRLEGLPQSRPSPRPSFETAAQVGGLLRMRPIDVVEMIRTMETLYWNAGRKRGIE